MSIQEASQLARLLIGYTNDIDQGNFDILDEYEIRYYDRIQQSCIPTKEHYEAWEEAVTKFWGPTSL